MTLEQEVVSKFPRVNKDTVCVSDERIYAIRRGGKDIVDIISGETKPFNQPDMKLTRALSRGAKSYFIAADKSGNEIGLVDPATSAFYAASSSGTILDFYRTVNISEENPEGFNLNAVQLTESPSGYDTLNVFRATTEGAWHLLRDGVQGIENGKIPNWTTVDGRFLAQVASGNPTIDRWITLEYDGTTNYASMTSGDNPIAHVVRRSFYGVTEKDGEGKYELFNLLTQQPLGKIPFVPELHLNFGGQSAIVGQGNANWDLRVFHDDVQESKLPRLTVQDERYLLSESYARHSLPVLAVHGDTNSGTICVGSRIPDLHAGRYAHLSLGDTYLINSQSAVISIGANWLSEIRIMEDDLPTNDRSIVASNVLGKRYVALGDDGVLHASDEHRNFADKLHLEVVDMDFKYGIRPDGALISVDNETLYALSAFDQESKLYKITQK